MSKLRKFLILVIIILAGVLGALLYQMKPTDSKFYAIDYNSIAGMDKLGEPYYLLVCDINESQCEYIREAVLDTDRAKYDIYYVDTTHYSEDISNEKLTDSERAQYAALFRQHMFDIGVRKIPTLQLRQNGEIQKSLEGFYSEEYNNALYESNELPIDIIIEIQKQFTKFVNTK